MGIFIISLHSFFTDTVSYVLFVEKAPIQFFYFYN